MTANNPYVPFPSKIKEIIKHTEKEWTFRMQYTGDVKPGQFYEVSVPKYGEAPISVSGIGEDFVDLTIRRVGRVTDEVFKLSAGDTILLRGPYGNGFDTSLYANGEVIQRLNADKMELSDGVGYMVRVYLVAPSSIQVKQNLEGMLAALAVQAEQNNSSADRTVVNNALQKTGDTFKGKVEDARVQASLSVIVDKVNSGSMAKDKALKEVYEIYKKNPNNDRICENLVTLCDICIMEYIIGDKWGASSVKSILDSLNNNKSSAFNRHKSKLAKSYSNIWNQLDPSNRMLLSGHSIPGTTLNEKGRALKTGLDYYKKLGDVRSSGRLSGLGGLGIFDDLDLPF